MKLNNKTVFAGVLLCLVCFIAFAGCLGGAESEENEIILADGASEANCSGVVINGDEVTITTAGTYALKGSLSEGCLKVNSAGEVKLILDGVSISNSKGPAIYASAGALAVGLKEGSENAFSYVGSYSAAEEGEEPDAAIFCKDSMIITGTGVLSVNSNYSEGISSKESLIIESGDITVDSAGGGIKGKDSLTVNGGNLKLKTAGNGLYSSKGFVAVNDGSIEIESEGKGIKGETYVELGGGTYNITSADDALHSDGSLTVNGGIYTIASDDDGVHAETTLTVNSCDMTITKCYEGLEGNTITVNGGNIKLASSDDGLNAAGESSGSDFDRGLRDGEEGTKKEQPAPTNGERAIPTGAENEKSPDGFPEWGRAPRDEGGAETENPPENMPERDERSERRELPEGDDMPKGGFEGGHGGGMGGGMMDYDSSCLIEINGGTLIINAEGDGLDSNGDIAINGGTVIVYGSENSGNGALDCGGSISFNGGTLFAIGSSGMAEAPEGGSSDSWSFMYSCETIEAETLISIVNAETGEVIFSAATPKRISSIIYGGESLKEGASLEIYTGGTLDGAENKGAFWAGGTLTGGELKETITLSEKLTRVGTEGFGGGMGGRRGEKFAPPEE